MNPDRMKEIYDLNLDIPGAKGNPVRRYSHKHYRSANWKAEDRRNIKLAISGLLLLALGVGSVVVAW